MAFLVLFRSFKLKNIICFFDAAIFVNADVIVSKIKTSYFLIISSLIYLVLSILLEFEKNYNRK